MPPLIENFAASSHPEHEALVNHIVSAAHVSPKAAEDFLRMTGATNDYMFSRQIQRAAEVRKAPWWKLF